MDSDSFAQLSINEFLDRLGSAAPTPGGGSGAALAGALAAALGQMGAALTVGQPKFASVEGQVREVAQRLARAGRMLRRLMDEDAAAYAELHAALKLDQADAERPERIRQAASLAAQVPLQTAALSHRVLLDLAVLSSLANPNLKADIQAGAHLARAATRAAAANVRANLSLMDTQAAAVVAQQLEQLLEDGRPG